MQVNSNVRHASRSKRVCSLKNETRKSNAELKDSFEGRSNNSFQPTRLSLAFMMLAWLNRGLSLASAGG